MTKQEVKKIKKDNHDDIIIMTSQTKMKGVLTNKNG